MGNMAGCAAEKKSLSRVHEKSSPLCGKKKSPYKTPNQFNLFEVLH